MVLILVPVVVGAIIGKICGGTLSRLAELRFRAPALIFAVLAAQALLGRAPGELRAGVVVLSYAAVGAWIVLNMSGRSVALRAAFVMVGLGWAMNFAAIAPTGAMPVSEEALRTVGVSTTINVQNGHLSKHARREERNATTWLGDEIPIPRLRAVISLGDIVLALGILLLVTSATVRPSPALLRHSQNVVAPNRPNRALTTLAASPASS